MLGKINTQKLGNLFLILVVSMFITSCCRLPWNKTNIRCYGSKDKKQYMKHEAFIVNDSNWKDTLSLVPVTVWTHHKWFTDKAVVNKYPTLIYHSEVGDKFDADSIIHFLQQYRPKRVTIVGTPPRELSLLIASYPSMEFGAGLRPDQILFITPEEYLDYWKKYKAVVYASDNYADSLIAASYASLLNVPLVIKNSVFDNPSVLTNKRLICVGEPAPATSCDEHFSREALQRRYLDLTHTNQVVLVNSNDLDLGINGSFQPEKSSLPISTTFTKQSLGAPYLSSAKHAMLLSVELNANNCGHNSGTSNTQFQVTDDFVENSLRELYGVDMTTENGPRYLTIVASPKAIPYWEDCGNSSSGAADWQYGSLDNEDPWLDVGRIYSQTISDVSSYIARSLFYERVFNNSYTASEYTGLAIAAPNFLPDQDNAQEIRDQTTAASYNTICFTWTGATDQPNCDIYTNILSTDYQERQFISFADHGSPTGWSGTLDSEDIPWLDLPYTFSLACLTNNFFGGQNFTFGPTWIRKGGLSYHASIPSTNGYHWEKWAVQELTGSSRLTLGGIATDLINRTDYSSEVKRQYILLGDPTLTPHSKEVIW